MTLAETQDFVVSFLNYLPSFPFWSISNRKHQKKFPRGRIACLFLSPLRLLEFHFSEQQLLSNLKKGDSCIIYIRGRRPSLSFSSTLERIGIGRRFLFGKGGPAYKHGDLFQIVAHSNVSPTFEGRERQNEELMTLFT